MALLSIDDLRAYYITSLYGMEAQVKAIDDVSLSIKENEIYGIAGESGCGKTTLIKAITGLISPPLTVLNGTVRYNFSDAGRHDSEIDILNIEDDRQRRRIRGSYISYIPQGSMSVLNPVRKIRRSFKDLIAAHKDINNNAEVHRMATEHLKHLGLTPDILDAYPHQLSGGMRQRVTIALSTILRPKIILADEPSTALDVVVQRGVIQLLKTIKEEMNNTIILVTHDIAIHANICDRLGIMYAGKIVEEAPIEELFENPYHPYTRFLLSSVPRIGDKSYRVSAPGAPPSLVDPPPGCRFHPRCPDAKGQCSEMEPKLVDIAPEHRVACFTEEAS